LESTKLRNARSTFKTPSTLRKSSGSGTSDPIAARKHPPSPPGTVFVAVSADFSAPAELTTATVPESFGSAVVPRGAAAVDPAAFSVPADCAPANGIDIAHAKHTSATSLKIQLAKIFGCTS
jgi:hypothetical protein